MAGLQYRDHQLDFGRGIGQMSDSASRAAIGIAQLRQQQMQQEFINKIRFAEAQRDARLDGVRERLYGAQEKRALAGAGYEEERANELRGLKKISDAVMELSYSADGPYGAPTIENAKLMNMNALTGQLRAAAVLGSSPAAQLLQPRNIPQGGTGINSLGDVIGLGGKAPERLYNLAPGGLLVNPQGAEVARGLPRLETGTNAVDPSLLLQRYGGGIDTSENLGFDISENPEDVQAYNALLEAFRDAAIRVRPQKTNTPTATGSTSKYKIINVSP